MVNCRMVQFLIFFSAFIAILALWIILGYYVFANWKMLLPGTSRHGFNHTLGYLVVLVIIFVMVEIMKVISDFIIIPSIDFTSYVHAFEGNITRDIQHALKNRYFTYVMIASYIFLYTYIVIFTPFLFMMRDERDVIRRYTLAFLFNYAVLIPIYLFISVWVTSYHQVTILYHITPVYPSELSPTQPLLYENENFFRLVMMISSLDNCFPSGHTSVAVIVFLTAWRWTKLRAFQSFSTFSAVLIVLSALYLGIHWMIDIFAGIVLGILAVWLAEQKRVMNRYVGLVERLNARMPKFSMIKFENQGQEAHR